MAKKVPTKTFRVKLTAVASIQMKTFVEIEARNKKEADKLAIAKVKSEGGNFEPDVWDDNDVEIDTIEAMADDDVDEQI